MHERIGKMLFAELCLRDRHIELYLFIELSSWAISGLLSHTAHPVWDIMIGVNCVVHLFGENSALTPSFMTSSCVFLEDYIPVSLLPIWKRRRQWSCNGHCNCFNTHLVHHMQGSFHCFSHAVCFKLCKWFLRWEEWVFCLWVWLMEAERRLILLSWEVF